MGNRYKNLISIDLDGTLFFPSTRKDITPIFESLYKLHVNPDNIILINTGRRYSYVPLDIPYTFLSSENGIFLRENGKKPIFTLYNIIPFVFYPLIKLASILFNGYNTGRLGSLIGNPRFQWLQFFGKNDGKRIVYSIFNRNKLTPIKFLQNKYTIMDNYVFIAGDDINDLECFLNPIFHKYTYKNSAIINTGLLNKCKNTTIIESECPVTLINKILYDVKS